MTGSHATSSRHSVVRSVATLVLACTVVIAAGCRGTTGGGSGGGSGGESGGSGSSASWKDALAERLAQEPGDVYCALGYQPDALGSIDAAANEKATQWEAAYPLKWVAMKPDGSEVWCTPLTWDPRAGVIDNPIAVIDPKTGEVKATVPASHPNRLAFSPDGSRVYVTLVLDNAVAVYDAKTREEIDRIEVGTHPLAITVSFDGTRAYVTHGSATVGEQSRVDVAGTSFVVPKLEAGSEYLAVIDLAKGEVTDRVELGGFGSGVAVSPDGSLVYATVSSVDPATVTGGTTPVAGGGTRWDGVAAVSTKDMTVVQRVAFPAGSAPNGVAFAPDGRKAYAICGASDDATPIDVATHTPGAGIDLDLGG